MVQNLTRCISLLFLSSFIIPAAFAQPEIGVNIPTGGNGVYRRGLHSRQNVLGTERRMNLPKRVENSLAVQGAVA